MTDTTGKTVTLHKGIIVTDVGKSHRGKTIRLCVADNGEIHHILGRVIQELPVTHRRNCLTATSMVGEWPKDWHRQ